MNIAIIGYGKMGKMIERIARERGHCIVLTVDVDNLHDFTPEKLAKAQAAIEFTNPEAAFGNVTRCLEYGVPVVSGSTGWFARLEEAKRICTDRNGSMLCTSNFSLGVNIFFELNRQLARIMNRFPEYSASIEEIHHTQKLDAPSGTAITLAEGVIAEIARIDGWELQTPATSQKSASMPIAAVRRDSVPGTHTVTYASEIDNIEMTHTAHSRTGFALGAVMAAEYVYDKKGFFSMRDLLEL